MIYTGAKLREISFPLGGIGTGSIGLAGNGHLIDWEIFNRPNKGSLNGYTFLAVRAEYPDGTCTARILQGDWNKDLCGTYSGAGSGQFFGFGFGPASVSMAGMPHFSSVTFDGSFPIARLTFEDEHFPATVVLTAFNPLIPLNADDSSIPAAFFDVELRSHEAGVNYTVVLAANNPFDSSVNQPVTGQPFTAVTMRAADQEPDEIGYGDLTAAVGVPDGLCQTYWYRGEWKDSLTTFWYELTHNCLHERTYAEPGKKDVCCVGAEALLTAGENRHFRFVLSWNVPNCYRYWKPDADEALQWKNYYTSLFADSAASCAYALTHWDRLYEQTEAFQRSLHASTLDPAVIDAVSATLSVLKSPTVLRLEDGTFYGWEGLHERGGSCEGTCTHVWSYAYALCFLFPELERSLRDTELRYDTDEHGWMRFRTKLPRETFSIKKGNDPGRPCVDGQMGTLIKIYRDWKLTGNDAWLRENWADICKVLEFAWSEHNTHEWDRNRDGVLEGRQHHTLDMEMFGPSGWLQGMYLAALKAAAEMAAYLGDEKRCADYTALFEKGCAWTKEHLFNGEYFIHQVDLTNKRAAEHFGCPEYWNEEKQELKYQIGQGSSIDQLLGQWHANICGLGDIFDPQQRKTAIRSMIRYNYQTSMREYANTWRVYALNDEAGTIMCAYPSNAQRPVIPIPYTDE